MGMSLLNDNMDLVDIDAILSGKADVPDRPVNIESLHKKAREVDEQTEKAKKIINKKLETIPGIEKIMESLDHDDEIKNHGESPSWSEVKSDENYCAVLDELRNIIRKYMVGTLKFEQAQMDILRMGAYLTDLSEQLSVFQAQSAEARSRLEDYRTKAYVKIKKTAQEQGCRVTDTDAKELANYYAIEISRQVANLEFVEKYLYNAYHSIRSFQEMLHYVAGRDIKLKTGPGMY